MQRDVPIIRRELQAIEKLSRSQGWQVMRDAMQAETDQVVRQMVASTSLPEADMHYRRGLVHAAQLLIDTPDKLIDRLRNELYLAEALEAAKGGEKPSKSKSDATAS